MKFIKAVGNDIHESIQLEIDYPSKHQDGKMPILDLKVWVEMIEDRPTIVHEFYAKDVSSKAMVNARSALPWKTKRTIITQEILRVFLNCNEFVPWQRVTEHVNEMVARLQYSGYCKKFRYEVVDAAIKAHDKIKRDDEQGIRPMYRPYH